MAQMKISLKNFEQRTVVILITAEFGKNQSGFATQDRVKKGASSQKTNSLFK